MANEIELGRSTGPAQTSDDRRAFLRKAAVGAGGLWVAPMAIQTSAGAQNGTDCPPEVTTPAPGSGTADNTNAQYIVSSASGVYTVEWPITVGCPCGTADIEWEWIDANFPASNPNAVKAFSTQTGLCTEFQANNASSALGTNATTTITRSPCGAGQSFGYTLTVRATVRCNGSEPVVVTHTERVRAATDNSCTSLSAAYMPC